MEVVSILKCLDLLGVVHVANWSLRPLHTIPLGLALEDKRELANLGLVSFGALQGGEGRLELDLVVQITWFAWLVLI